MFVIGTAGHVDHGKSTLIHALTGIDPDRLREEKKRGLTIELGFAWLTLPSGRDVSIVDVPGHERFVRHMLMGVGGIDLALLVIAADESVMPQTREHLAILDLVQISRGIVVITKSDAVDREFLELVQAEADEALEGTSLEGSPILSVSAMTGEGLDDLVDRIEGTLSEMPDRRDLGRPRLPVDRSFTISGFGTVVTGTLSDGALRVGQEVEILPGKRTGRIRGLQTHRHSEPEAAPGTRVAVNLGGIPHDDIERGDVLTTPGWLTPTDAADVSVRLIPDAPRALRHNVSVTLHTGASETPARLRLLDVDELSPGESGWAQAKLQKPLPMVKGDFFVIRDSMTTLGGGVVVEPHAKRHRRKHAPTLERLAVLARGSESDVALSALSANEPTTIPALAQAANLSERAVSDSLEELVTQGLAVSLGEGKRQVFFSSSGWSELARRAREIVDEHHRQRPLRPGMPREELRNRLGMRAAVFDAAIERMAAESALEEDGSYVRMPGHTAQLTDEQRRAAEEFVERLEKGNPYLPPTDGQLDPELLSVLESEGRIVRAGDDIVFLKPAYDEMVERIKECAREHGKITISDVRELFGTSRKYT
ncbi:MAG: selenocysteine-specific translation elongation factor, partial [Chloroflexota bacterium]